MKRRAFITQASLVVSATKLAKAREIDGQIEPIIVFEKPIQNLPYDVMGEHLAKMGVQGIEATIRKGGHIEPEHAESEVPRMVESLAKNDQKALIAATNVNEANKNTERFLKILKENGISRYRMGYYHYDLTQTPLIQLRENRDKLRDLAALNEELGVQALYQIHSGAKYAGSLSWDAALMFEGLNADYTAVAFDLRHIRAETGKSFDLALANLRPHIRSIYVKDALWTGDRADHLENVPLDTGMVNKGVFDKVRKGLGFVPYSLHMEWGESQLYPKQKAMEAVSLIARDVKILKSWI